jgi:hypothetical protein
MQIVNVKAGTCSIHGKNRKLIQNTVKKYQPFNAGIKSLRAKLSDEIFNWGF